MGKRNSVDSGDDNDGQRTRCQGKYLGKISVETEEDCVLKNISFTGHQMFEDE